MSENPRLIFVAGNSQYTIGFIAHMAFDTEERAKQHFIVCTNEEKCNHIQKVSYVAKEEWK